jgi:hypothetical protein
MGRGLPADAERPRDQGGEQEHRGMTRQGCWARHPVFGFGSRAVHGRTLKPIAPRGNRPPARIRRGAHKATHVQAKGRPMQFTALLLTATVFGGMVLYSFGFAMMLFKIMPMAEARVTLRKAFPYYYLFAIFAPFAAAGATVFVDLVAAVLLALTGALSIYARQVLMHQINRASDEDAAGKEGAKRRFDLLHGISISIQLLQIGIVAYVLWRFL